MKMKKYYASSIPEAMKQVRAELGEDAVILNSKVVITKKFFGMIKRKVLKWSRELMLWSQVMWLQHQLYYL